MESNKINRSSALSEAEYFAYTGQKLGETYEQTKQEAYQALGITSSEVKLTKEEEERLVQAYIDLRYQSYMGLASSDQTLSLIPGKEKPKELQQAILTTAEKGLLRKEFEEKGLKISEETLREYELLKYERPDITFPQYAYEKTIGSKSEIEKVGLGLFTQQALGFYELGRHLGYKQEYLDLMSIGLSYKPMLEEPIARGFLPLQRNDTAFNIGVIVGTAIDIITLKSFAKSIHSFVKAPSSLSAFLSTSKLELGLQEMTARYRDIGIQATKMTRQEFIRASINPINIFKGIKEDVTSFFTKDPMQREVKNILTPGLKAQVEEVITEVKPTLSEVKQIGFIPGKYEGKMITRVESTRGLEPRTNIIFNPRFESRPLEYKSEALKEYFEGVKSDLRLSKMVYQYERKGDISVSISSSNNIQPVAPTTTTKPKISLSPSPEIKALKQELKKDIADYYLKAKDQEESIAQTITTTTEDITPTITTTKQGHKEEQVLLTAATDTYTQDIMRINKELEKQLSSIQSKASRRKRGEMIEYEIVRYPSGIKPIMPIPNTLQSSSSRVRPSLSISIDLGLGSRLSDFTKSKPLSSPMEASKERFIPSITDITSSIPKVTDTTEEFPSPTLETITTTTSATKVTVTTIPTSMIRTMSAERLRSATIPKLRYDMYNLPIKPPTGIFKPPPTTRRSTKLVINTKPYGKVEIFKYAMPKFIFAGRMLKLRFSLTP